MRYITKVKEDLHITWLDDDKLLERYIDEAQLKILTIVGMPDWVDIDGADLTMMERQILALRDSLMYGLVQYKWNKVEHLFDIDFRINISTLQYMYATHKDTGDIPHLV